jgi:hypothetical protein
VSERTSERQVRTGRPCRGSRESDPAERRARVSDDGMTNDTRVSTCAPASGCADAAEAVVGCAAAEPSMAPRHVRDDGADLR